MSLATRTNVSAAANVIVIVQTRRTIIAFSASALWQGIKPRPAIGATA
jgi:hypothetical protein